MMDEDWLHRVDSLISQGKVSEAQDLLIEMVNSKPENVQAWLLLADSISEPNERLLVLEEALRFNPNNQELQQAHSSMIQGEMPPGDPESFPLESGPENPVEAHSTNAFAFTPEEWEAFKTDTKPPQAAAVPESFQPPDLLNEADDEKQWLETLRTMSGTGPISAVPPAFLPDEEPVAPGNAFTWQREPAESQDEISPELASLAWQSTDQEDASLKSGSLFGNPAQEPARYTQPVERQIPIPALSGLRARSRNAGICDESLDEISLQDLEEPAPRRSWLGIILTAVILVGLMVAGYLAWPSISGIIFPPAAVVVPTDLPAGAGAVLPETPTPLPSPSITPTPAPTRTRTPVPPSATPAPVSAIVNAVPVSVQNIQQFKLLAQSKGEYQFSNNAQVGAALSDALTVRVWDVVKDEIRLELKGPRAPIQAVAISPDGRLVAAASQEPAVYVWNADTGAAVSTLEFSKELVEYFKDKNFSHTLQLKFGPEGKTLVATSLLGVTWWELDKKAEHHLYPLTVAELVTFRAQAETPKNGVATSFMLAFSPDGKALAVGSPFKVYLLFWPSGNPWASLPTGKPLIDLKFFSSNMLAMFHPGTLSIWETISARQVLTYPGLKILQAQEIPPGAAFRADGKMMAVEAENSRGQPGALKLIDLPSGKVGLILDSNVGSPIVNPIFSADGKLIMAHSGGDVFVWEVATGKELRRIANRKGFSTILKDGRVYIEYGSVNTVMWGGLP